MPKGIPGSKLISNKDKKTDGKEQKPKKKNIYITKSDDLRRLLQEVINDLRKSDEGTLCNRSSRIIAAAQVMIDVLKTKLIEDDISKLMEVVKEKQYGGGYGDLKRT